MSGVKSGSHTVPIDAVQTFQDVWVREKMAGKELASADATDNRLAWVSAAVTGVTSAGIFTTLQAETNTIVKVVVASVLAVAAVLSGLQARATKQADAKRAELAQLVRTFGPLKAKLLNDIAQRQLKGTNIPEEHLKEATDAVQAENEAHPQQYSSFTAAEESVRRQLVLMGLWAAGPARTPGPAESR